MATGATRGSNRAVLALTPREDRAMAADSEKTVRFTPEEFQRLQDQMTKAAQKTSHLAAASALEQFAGVIERAPVTTASEEAREGAEAMRRAAVGEARRLAQALRDGAEHG